jgi:hypothetical protein
MFSANPLIHQINIRPLHCAGQAQVTRAIQCIAGLNPNFIAISPQANVARNKK